MKKLLSAGLIALVILVLGLAAAGEWYRSKLAPLAKGPKQFVRFAQLTSLENAGLKLESQGIVRSAAALNYYAILNRKQRVIPAGTYQLSPGMESGEILTLLQKPISNFFRIPETNLSYRTANLLGKNEIADTEEYKQLIKEPSRFKDVTKVELPSDSLEGYLYPDTYDLPPLLGAEGVISKQLQAFEKKVWPLIEKSADRKAVLTIASMVELEAGVDAERAKIAGVIQNRIDKKMRLEIDATVLYALQEWRRLYYKDYRNTNSPYNTYKVKGLPPGPICSPSVKSVQAALAPAKHNYLYYVALPNRTHLFAATYPEHLKNIQVARRARDSAAKLATTDPAKPSK